MEKVRTPTKTAARLCGGARKRMFDGFVQPKSKIPAAGAKFRCAVAVGGSQWRPVRIGIFRRGCHHGRRTVKTLGAVAANGADAGQIADTAVAIWRAIDGALSPVIGTRGSGALFKRSLHLARADYPWLAAAYEGSVQPGEFSALRTALAQQPATSGAAGQDALLKIFEDLLVDLIGRSLMQRLLQSVWESPPSAGIAVQDKSP